MVHCHGINSGIMAPDVYLRLSSALLSLPWNSALDYLVSTSIIPVPKGSLLGASESTLSPPTEIIQYNREAT